MSATLVQFDAANASTPYDWYDATGYKVPFPGEKTVRPASDVNKQAQR